MEKVITLYESNARDIPKTLNKISKAITNKEYGDTISTVVILFNKENLVDIFGLGDNNWFKTIGLKQLHY